MGICINYIKEKNGVNGGVINKLLCCCHIRGKKTVLTVDTKNKSKRVRAVARYENRYPVKQLLMRKKPATP
jgi:hypothetical protein